MHMSQVTLFYKGKEYLNQLSSKVIINIYLRPIKYNVLNESFIAYDNSRYSVDSNL